MAQYKYYLEMSYIKDKTNREIKPENIKSFFIDSNYSNSTMATMYAVLVLDKNFYDEIIKNAKLATMILNIYKISVDDKTSTKILTNYKGECYYFIPGDINYNKEIDYADGNADREDIYKEVHIGLIYKEGVEYNKQTNNTAIVNTTMLNSVMQYMQNMPLLLENFTYNDVISQLIIPPQDSLFKTIDFLNSIKVFYDTQYRFFIEPGCIYLISSSGKAIQKNNEKYTTVMFKIHSIVGDNANILGMEEDDTNKLYSIDVNVLDTHYLIDNDTCKTVNTISSITNPSKDNSLISLGAVQTAINNVLKIKNKILGDIKANLGSIKAIPSSINNFKVSFRANTIATNTNTTEALSNIDAAVQVIKDAPEEPTTTTDSEGNTTVDPSIPYITPEDKQIAIEYIATIKENLLSNTSKLSEINIDYLKAANSTMGTLGKTTTNIPGMFNCITPINITDNINAIKKLSGYTVTESKRNIAYTNSKIVPHIATGNNIVDGITTVHTYLESFGLTEMEEALTAIQKNATGLQTAVNNISSTIGSYVTIVDDFGSVCNSTSSHTIGLDAIKVDLKSQFTNMKIDIQNSGNSAKSTLSSIIGSATNVLNTLKSKGLSLSSLRDLSDDINKVKDISQIGKLGISKFDVGLDFADGLTGGSKIIKIDNDNANKLKNIKSNMENKANKLTINKNGLDLSVFSINKEYVVKNYDAHSNKDGRFILSRKVEIFLREDDVFILNMMMEFEKLADENKSSSVAAELGKT